jgi:hypothetical protein
MIGFITEDGYAAVPFGKELMIIYNGQQLDVVKTVKKARGYIANHKTNSETVQPTPKKSASSARVRKTKT